MKVYNYLMPILVGQFQMMGEYTGVVDSAKELLQNMKRMRIDKDIAWFFVGFVEEYWFWDKHGETSIDEDNTFLGVDDANTNLNEARLFNIKSEYRIPEQSYDAICQLINDVLPKENNMVELEKLWEEGIVTYDISFKRNFHLRAVLLWTISDFPAFAMFFGWSTTGKLACPHCGKHTQIFRQKNGNKMSWLDCYRRFLQVNHPYTKDKHKFKKNREVTEGPPPSKNGEKTLREIEQLGLVKVTELNADDVNKRCGDHI
uniref:Transposase-associated domain-containing protein n=1 Tax=Lactuca sativa TaxID=4236 RepID=A0A9R1UZH7_LACSA|nr:hypothetical protein LSAT_V11C700365110 [Lactuca sativa]